MERAIRDGYTQYLRTAADAAPTTRVSPEQWQTVLVQTIREEIEECMRQPTVAGIVDVVDLLEAYATALAWSRDEIRHTREERYAQFGGYEERRAVTVAHAPAPEPLVVVERAPVDPQTLLHATRIRSSFPETTLARVIEERSHTPLPAVEQPPQIAHIVRVRPSTHLMRSDLV
jgi:predicted house-cleaning noncanonical NTP pyrophosphatase (MazG superfamily)